MARGSTYLADLCHRCTPLRRATESARASLLANQERKGTAMLTVVTSVARGYTPSPVPDRGFAAKADGIPEHT